MVNIHLQTAPNTIIYMGDSFEYCIYSLTVLVDPLRSAGYSRSTQFAQFASGVKVGLMWHDHS
jgi:hypothetical protein